jgi:arylsulfatase A-like enzyme
VVLVSIDTLRADHVGAYGYERDTTPFLDRLARGGIQFNRAYSQASWTLPAHMSLLTSLHPEIHGVLDDELALAEEVTTLAEALQAAGLRTAAFVTCDYVGRAFGFGQGFQDFAELLPEDFLDNPFGNEEYTAREVTDHAVEWLQQHAGGSFFLFLHYFDPHADYAPPEPYASLFDPDYRGTASGEYKWLRPYIKRLRRPEPEPKPIAPRDFEHVVALYDGEIRYVDTELARLYDALERKNLLDETLIVVTADHGEEFNDHGSMEGHGWTLYEEVIHVPLILRFPGSTASGLEVDELVQLIDVAPSIVDALGIEAPAGFQGQSLLSSLRTGSPGSQPRLIVSHTQRFSVKRSVRNPRYKLIATEARPATPILVPDPPGYELYDLVDDPAERQSLYDRLPDAALSMRKVLDGWMETVAAGRGKTPPQPAEALTPAEIERLKSLGYVQ